MGAAIAAHFANSGLPVVLLDIPAKDGDNRNAIAEGAVQKLLKTDPAPLMRKSYASRIETGNIDDNLDMLSDCDWIVEAVIERTDIKRSLYEKIDNVRKDGAIVSSNTSTIPLHDLTDGFPDSFRKNFLITHFFNPPRYMRLLELVEGPDTDADAVETIRKFGDVQLGKSVVMCKDTPGFIANRIGIYWLQCGVIDAIDGNISIEEADAIVGQPMGFPKTGVFGLLDMVGLDLMPHVVGSMQQSLPPEDDFHKVFRELDLVQKMIETGYTGRKGKGGFYRLNRQDGGRVKEAVDLHTGEYHKASRPKPKCVAVSKRGGLRKLLSHDSRGGQYGWNVLAKTLCYAASLVPEISDDVASVDEAMRTGFNWRWGPFELIDKIGAGWFTAQLRAKGMPVPELLETVGSGTFYRTNKGVTEQQTFANNTVAGFVPLRVPEGVLRLSDIKRRGKPVAKNWAASLWDIGDGVVCLEFHSRMNALGPGALFLIEKTLAIVPGQYKALVIHNEGENFSVGANIAVMLVAAKLRLSFVIDWMLKKGQRAYNDLKYAPFPVVSAPSGMALGGGCEILLHSDAVQANAETYAGLVEVGVGVIPGWGGCKEMLVRHFTNPKRAGGPMPPISKVFELIGLATVARSAPEAQEHLFLRPTDSITMNKDRVLADAKAKALALAENYTPPERQDIALPGPTAVAAVQLVVDGFRKLGQATPHDAVVASHLATVLSGGDTDITETRSEEDLLRLERESFLKLAKHPGTIARIQHMLQKGRPLRN